MAIIPKPSINISAPSIMDEAPWENANKNVAVIGPEATPPESNPIPTKIFGMKYERIIAIENPGPRTSKVLCYYLES